jgi:hypothetical protein
VALVQAWAAGKRRCVRAELVRVWADKWAVPAVVAWRWEDAPAVVAWRWEDAPAAVRRVAGSCARVGGHR